MYHCIFNYNDILIFAIFQIKISPIILLKNIKYLLSLYFLSLFFEAVKEFHKYSFLILINRTTLYFIFFGRQVRKNACQYLSTIKVQLHSSFIIPKKINLSSHCQEVSKIIGSHFKINMFPCYFQVNLNKSVHPIALQKYELYLGVDWLQGQYYFGEITPIERLGKASQKAQEWAVVPD